MADMEARDCPRKPRTRLTPSMEPTLDPPDVDMRPMMTIVTCHYRIDSDWSDEIMEFKISLSILFMKMYYVILELVQCHDYYWPYSNLNRFEIQSLSLTVFQAARYSESIPHWISDKFHKSSLVLQFPQPCNRWMPCPQIQTHYQHYSQTVVLMVP